MAQVSLSKPLDNGYSLIAAGGDIYESYKGKLGYLGVTRQINKACKCRWQLGYFAYYPRVNGDSLRDDRLRGSLIHQFSFDGWKLEHRSRAEYRKGEITKGFRYRPAFQFSRPLTFTKTKVIPYVETEAFYDLRQDRVTTIFFTAGIKWPINHRFIIDVRHFNILTTADGNHTKGPILGLHMRL